MAHSISNLELYKQSVQKLRFGKRVGPFIYFHIDGMGLLPGALGAIVRLATEQAEKQSIKFNVVKAGIREPTISLLFYPGFLRQPFPVLSQSARLRTDTHELVVTDFCKRKNRPVLHRKELLLPPGHKEYARYAELTRQAEELGLFKDPKKIGLELGWREALRRAKVRPRGHKLVKSGQQESAIEPSEKPQILRHRTALSREHLSLPLQAIQRFGYLDGTYSVFDYGCGRGDDLRALQGLGINASGWDPHYRPRDTKKAADIVNLGYVINVIEDIRERDETVQQAFSFARKILVVSALIGSPAYTRQPSESKDGVLTSIGTFQKYYAPDELENYVRSLLSVPVVSIAQGIVLAFRDDVDADRFRALRAGARRVGIRGSKQRAAEVFLLDENGRDILSAYWERCLELGRVPLESELDEEASLQSLGLSPTATSLFLTERFGTDKLTARATERKTELLVQFALGQFDGRVYYKYLAPDVQEDIKVFFGGFSALMDQAKALLFSVGDTNRLAAASAEASCSGFGYVLPRGALQLHVSLIDRLPSILQVYIGCALRLVGGLGRADLVKIHVDSGKVSLMAYDDFDGGPVPYLIERIKVNLWARRIEYFDYVAGFVPPPLLMKSLFLAETQENFALQETFDRELLRLGIFDVSAPHPSKAEFEQKLRDANLTIRGFELIPGQSDG